MVFLFAFFSCSDPVDERFEDMEQASQTVAELIGDRPAYQGFAALLTETGLDSVLNRNTAFTVFALADDKLPDLTGFSVEEKREMLTNHISNFVLYSAYMDAGHSLKMMSGKNIFFGKSGTAIWVNDEVTLLEPNQLATNGVLHEVDGLIPVRPNLLEYIQNHPDYAYLAAFFNEGTTLLFDSLNSVPIGINEEGQTVYDTLWKQSNVFFSNMADLGGEDQRFTMFLAPDALLDTAAEGSYKFGYLANPGSFILEGLYTSTDLPGSYTAVDGFNLVIGEGNYTLLDKLSNGYAYTLHGFEGIRIPRKFRWELTDVSDFDSIRHIKATQYADKYDQFDEITINDLDGGFTSFKYEIFSGPLNKDYLQIITTAGTSAGVQFNLPPVLPGKYMVRIGAQIRRVDGMLFDGYINEERFGTGISLNGGEYNWAPTDMGVISIIQEYGNTFTIAISGSNNNYVRGYFDYLEFEPVN
jgi:hypothetical protein